MSSFSGLFGGRRGSDYRLWGVGGAAITRIAGNAVIALGGLASPTSAVVHERHTPTYWDGRGLMAEMLGPDFSGTGGNYGCRDDKGKARDTYEPGGT
jgi:hypothetical protein